MNEERPRAPPDRLIAEAGTVREAAFRRGFAAGGAFIAALSVALYFGYLIWKVISL